MEWYQCLTIIASMLGMMMWSSRERRTDNLYILKLIDEMRKEMKEFHGRLCSIEERNRK